MIQKNAARINGICRVSARIPVTGEGRSALLVYAEVLYHAASPLAGRIKPAIFSARAARIAA